MSLQGTLRTLGIAEVLEFLAGRSATGRLEITADSGHATYWVSKGEIASVDYSFARESGTDAAEATYYALAEVEGIFHFDEDQRPEGVEETETVSDVLSRTADTADGWSYVEEVISSPDHWLTRSERLEEAVTIQPEWWTALAEIDEGLSSQMLASRLEMRALAASTMASEMVRHGLLQVSDPQPVDQTTEAEAFEVAAEAADAAVEADIEELIEAPFLSDEGASSDSSAEADPETAVSATPADSGLHNLFGGGAPTESASDSEAEMEPVESVEPAPHLTVVDAPEPAADPFTDAFQPEATEAGSTRPEMPEIPEIPEPHTGSAEFDAPVATAEELETPAADSWDDDDGWATDHSQAPVPAAVGEAYQQAPAATDVFENAPATDASMPPAPEDGADHTGEATEYDTEDRSSVLKFLRRD